MKRLALLACALVIATGCSKNAEVTMASLDDWEQEWEKNSQRNVQPKLLPVDLRSPVVVIFE